MSAREKILEAVVTLLGTDTGAEFTYDRLAREANVSRQTVYAHFPTRADLLVAVADHARAKFDADRLSIPILEAATGVDALTALVAFHVSFTPKVLRQYRAVEYARSTDPELMKAFGKRTRGRDQLIRLVMTRLQAEGRLHPAWSVDSATDFVVATVNASTTYELLENRGWSIPELEERLLRVFNLALLTPDTEGGDLDH